jgi:ankyrin repeat protein
MKKESSGGVKNMLVGKDLDKRIRSVLLDGDVIRVRELLETYGDVVERKLDRYDWKAIHFAALSGHADVVMLLIQNGADVNAVNKDKWTSLHLAAWKSHVEVAKLLIQNGADVNAVNKDNRMSLHFAAENGHVDTVKLLIQNGADVNTLGCIYKSALRTAAIHGYVKIAKLLIQGGADVHESGKNNVTILHVASSWGHADFVKLLIQNGADVNAVEISRNRTSLHFAVREGHFNVAKMLIQNGADVNALSKHNESVLFFDASRWFRKSVVPTLALVCLGAKIDLKALKRDKTGLLCKIKDRIEKLRNGDYHITNLYSNEERKFMWNLAFLFAWKTKFVAFKVYYKIRSFITFNGIFMAFGFDLGKKNIWRTEV